MALRISMSPPPDGDVVKMPRIVGWTERTYSLYDYIGGSWAHTSFW